jgi:hypothetical protein
MHVSLFNNTTHLNRSFIDNRTLSQFFEFLNARNFPQVHLQVVHCINSTKAQNHYNRINFQKKSDFLKSAQCRFMFTLSCRRRHIGSTFFSARTFSQTVIKAVCQLAKLWDIRSMNCSWINHNHNNIHAYMTWIISYLIAVVEKVSVHGTLFFCFYFPKKEKIVIIL